MPEQLIGLLQNIPPEIATLILAIVPIGELRGALPIALIIYKLPIWSAVFFAVIGNMLPVYFILIFFEKIASILQQKSPTADKVLTWLFSRTRRKLNTKVQKYGYWALTIFVAIPLPVTGAWTGSLAAFVFGLPKKKSFIAIFLGVLISAAIVSMLTMGSIAAFQRFLMLK